MSVDTFMFGRSESCLGHGTHYCQAKCFKLLQTREEGIGSTIGVGVVDLADLLKSNYVQVTTDAQMHGACDVQSTTVQCSENWSAHTVQCERQQNELVNSNALQYLVIYYQPNTHIHTDDDF